MVMTYIVPLVKTPSWVSGFLLARWVRNLDIKGQRTERIARILLDAEDWKLYCHVQGGMCDVGLLIAQTHGPDKTCGRQLGSCPTSRRETHARI